MKVMQCTQCGAKVHMAEDGSFVCDYCGSVIAVPEEQVAATQAAPQAPAQPTPTQPVSQPRFDPSITYTKTGERYVHRKKREKWLAIVLCVTLGIFGAHRFYEGKTRSGLLYLCTLGLLCVGVIFDFFTLLSRPEYY